MEERNWAILTAAENAVETAEQVRCEDILCEDVMWNDFYYSDERSEVE